MKKLLLLAIAALPLVFSSCLKDKNRTDRIYGMEGVEDIKLVEFPDATELVAAQDFSATATVVNLVEVRLNSAQPLDHDITVTLVADNSLVTAAGLPVVPSAYYTLGNLNVVIPKGQRSGFLQVTLQTSQLLSDTYALGFRITAVSDASIRISANYDEIVVAVPIKNKYDGIYGMRIRMRAPANDRPTVNVSQAFDWGGDVFLLTVSANQNDLFDDWGFGTYIQPIQTNTFAYSGFGSTAPRFTFNTADDKMTAVVNNFPSPPNGRAFMIDPAQDSKFDPATHNVYAHFIMTQPGFQPLFIADTFLYHGPR